MGKYAIDCEMVGGHGKSLLARVSIVDDNCRVVYDHYVQPTESVYDYRTAIHGIQPHQLQSGKKFRDVQQEVKNIISGNILIGHSVDKDLGVLNLTHPDSLIRDVSTYPPFKMYNTGGKPSLKDLARIVLGINIQSGYHDSVEDAKAAMRLYKKYEHSWR